MLFKKYKNAKKEKSIKLTPMPQTVNIILDRKGGRGMVTALNVGNSILARAFTENIDITPMKLQKMIYFVYRGYLKETKIPLFNERFEVWTCRP